MRKLFLSISLLSALTIPALVAPKNLFDGQSLAGWDGETNKVWRTLDNAIIGGSMQGNPRNEFLATTQNFRNFHLTLEYKLVGTEGFVNSGVQFRSKRIANPPNEMSGYQADIGAGFSGCLYDESRRNRMLAVADTNLVQRLEKRGDWNHYEVIANGPEIQIWLNGQRTVDWIEREANMDREGLIALQIHGNNKAEVSFRNISIEELPNPTVPTQGEILGRFGEIELKAPIPAFPNGTFEVQTNEVIVLVGQENFVREQKAGELESRLASAFAEKRPRFRSMAWQADTVYEQWRDLNFGSWAAQLETAGATMVVAQFGQIEALDGVGRLPEFTAAYHRLLDQFAGRTRRLVLVSPIPFEKPNAPDAPDLTQRNSDVAAYVEAIRDLARQRSAIFVDLFHPWALRPPGTPFTDDGIHLIDAGVREVARAIARQLGVEENPSASMAQLREGIVEKNRLWFDCWRPANWSFVYGDRVSQAFGKGAGSEISLKQNFERLNALVLSADDRIHALARGESVPPTVTPPKSLSPEEAKALTPEQELATFTLTNGFAMNLFASERDGVVKPTQIAWDERGRLYVACSPTYPHLEAGEKPADYILVLEDTDGDGVADKSWRFAEGLTMVQGVEPGAGGLFVCDFDQILHLRDTDGDGRADERRVYLSGFGIGDTHQLVNSITHGPDGSLWFTQGLHAFSRVETPWGVARLDRAGVWRLTPGELRLEGFFGGGMAGANCWGVAFDDYGQVFHKSGDRPHGYWTVPGMVRGASPMGSGSSVSADVSYANSPEQYHSAGPLFDTSPKTTSIDIIGTRALPDELQGCAVIGGYFGAVVELHRFEDLGSGFKTTQLPRLVRSSDASFRPVDVSVGPDGAIYAADWFNPIIGHYQASYVDPKRDKTHGRIWRISSKNHKPVKQPNLAAMKPAELFEQLTSPERWTRYQVKRLLFDAPRDQVLSAGDNWLSKLSPSVPDYERVLLAVIGVFEAHHAVRPDLLNKLLNAKDARVRAYGARVIGAWAEQLPNAMQLLGERVHDENPRVRLEAVVAASYLQKPEAVQIVTAALESPRDKFLDYAIRQSARALQPSWGRPFAENKLALNNETERAYLSDLSKNSRRIPTAGETIYEMACLPCHQPEGKGLPGVYPPLAGSEWVRGDASRLIKFVLHGLSGPITVANQTYGGPNSVPMPSMAGLSDEQIADVLTFVRGEFGGKSSPVTSDQVKETRASTARRELPWTVEELSR
jgi:putative membrane-bound dehydrogenase-like protein